MDKTTIQISEDLRKKLKVIASYRDISYEDALEDFVNLFTAVIPFKNELEFAKWFEINLQFFGFAKIIEKHKGFPDYIVEDKSGKQLRVELEVFATDFLRHKHDPKKVDLILCIYSDRKVIDGVPVTAILDTQTDTSEIIDRKRRTSITMDAELSEKLDEYVKLTNAKSRSEALESIIKGYLTGKHTSVILAGGKPSKLYVKELHTYRPLVKIGDKTLIEDVVSKIVKAGYYNIIIVGSPTLIFQIKKVLKEGGGYNAKITYLEEKGGLGTAKTLEYAKSYLKSDFLVLPCDHWFEFDLKGLEEAHRRYNGLATLAIHTRTSFDWKTSIVEMDGYKIVNYEEFPKKPKTHLVSMLIGFMKPDVFNLIPPGDVYWSLQEHIFPKLADDGKLVGYPISGKWVNVHKPSDIKKIEG